MLIRRAGFSNLGLYDGRVLRSVRRLIGLLAMLVPFLFYSCASAPPPKPPPVPAFNIAALTTTLHRGVSTGEDVRNALGEPNGSGGFLFPFDPERRSVWFYENVKVTTGGGKVDIQHDVLMVFIKANRFDGFLWFSDARKNW